MRIDKIKIENFKLFTEQEFSFNSRFNLVVGENGAGKTSLLEALAVALGGWAHAYIKSEKNLRPIADDEIREIQKDGCFDKTENTKIQAIGNTSIIGLSQNSRQQIDVIAEWARWREENKKETFLGGGWKSLSSDSHEKEYNLNFDSIKSDILYHIEEGKTYNLPLIAVYECDRLWLPKKELNLEASAKARYSRFDPYIDCFHTATDHQAIGEWLLKQKLISLDEGEETPISQSMCNAAKTALEKCVGFKFDIKQARVMVEFENGKIIPFEHLSDGQRTIVSLFCDIARRAAILNPHLGGNASAKTKGVVLIDEIELHLHPAWQQNIVGNLKKAFPNIQFFATTHSPQIVSTVPSHQICILDNGKVYQAEAGTQGAEVSRILKRIFGVAPRPPNEPNTKLLNEYLDLVYADKWNEKLAKEKRAKLDAIYQGNEPALTEADLYIENRQWELE